MKNEFRQLIEKEFVKTIKKNEKKFLPEDTLRIDLHCHDKNSDTPDELLGRLMNVPETWLETSDLVRVLKSHNCNALTVTNHNNARSCYELLEKGVDVLVGAEFSCYVPEFSAGIHVLAYGFNRDQEEVLNKKRSNLYDFLKYARREDIPTIWAHPLYYYTSRTRTMEFFEKLSLMFERFEVVNGQRNTWQNVLSMRWVESLSKEKIDRLAKKHNIDPSEYCRNIYKKSMAGGSDSHMGIFPGLSGTLLHIPGLSKKSEKLAASKLALEAIKKGNMLPYGTPNESERLSVALVDYFCQVALHMSDPGLIRILLHKGSSRDKMLGFFLANGFNELKRHKVTMKFLKTLHESFTGTVPHSAKQILIGKAYRKIFEDTRQLAKMKKNHPEKMDVEYLNNFIQKAYDSLSSVFFSRLQEKVNHMNLEKNGAFSDPETFIKKLELPSDFRSFFEPSKNSSSQVNLTGFFDGLSFPLLASAILLGAAYASAKVMHHSRDFLLTLSDTLNFPKPKGRILWMSDTFGDKNGVSMSTMDLHAEIKARNLPVDILVCDSTLESGENLIVLRPEMEFTLPFYKEQPVRLPNIMEVFNLFTRGGYDRIVAATEGPMGLLSLLLKTAYSVPAYFYIHTDWITFMKKTLSLDVHMINRVRRMLRIFYRQFDGHFVLNSDQKTWLSGRDMGLPKDKIFLTGHWIKKGFGITRYNPAKIFQTAPGEKVILYAGRISHEKGVMDLPYLYKKVKKEHPYVRLVAVGSGPAEEELKNSVPDMIHLPWVEYDRMKDIFSSADLLVLPSVFDTFGRVVLEAMSCGLPVASYATMGPKDIIEHGESGFLAKSKKKLSGHMIEYFDKPLERQKMAKKAVKRSKEFDSSKILSNLMSNLGIPMQKNGV